MAISDERASGKMIGTGWRHTLTVRLRPARQGRRPFGAASRRLFWAYLLLITLAEVVASAVDPWFGLVAHAMILVALLVHGGIGRSEAERNLALALTLAPLIRLLSFSLPLTQFPQAAWYPIV